MFWFGGSDACRILTPQPGLKPAPSAMKGKVLTPGPPEESLIPVWLSKGYWEKGLEENQLEAKLSGWWALKPAALLIVRCAILYTCCSNKQMNELWDYG